MPETPTPQARIIDEITWIKSSYTANTGNCVEVALIANENKTLIRDSKDPKIFPIQASTEAWKKFLSFRT
ncbi:DUF397 domain-containing protein [Streptomyces alkaliphilus]|uniref:DUF397 domain-containing protein n=1 Tax=Streptomyces alkaliphilus TaxID=1472722 RepID=UPI002B1FE91A|nr:DUF397 domain-containing protein [Streptomyces alkaliphilus]